MTAARVGAVELVGVDRDDAGNLIKVNATVQGHHKLHIVDFDPAWSPDWLCTCGHAPDCSHIRATRRLIRERTPQ
jgi:hypothetical protein